jgi:hypothetical protein
MSIKQLVLAGAHVLMEVKIVCLAASVVRASQRLAIRRVARSTTAGR